jgi:hypothetical protein
MTHKTYDDLGKMWKEAVMATRYYVCICLIIENNKKEIPSEIASFLTTFQTRDILITKLEF